MNHILHYVFLVAFITTWFVVGYQFILFLAGQVLLRKSLRERKETIQIPDLPHVTVLIPAHNEERVIERTVRCLLALDYPDDRLDILVIDDASTDATPQVLDRMARNDHRVRVLHRVKPDGGRGKAAALNAALKITDNEFIAIYDADNCPEPDALKQLIAQFRRRPELGAVLGRFRTGNRKQNLLTRFINIEGLGFQGIMQAGRWQLLGVSSLSGTNYVIRRSALEQIGGWDVEALAEDAELSVRMYQYGYRIAFIPNSVSWEQEPETLRVWIKQRTRWARGNNYAIAKLVRTFFQSRSILHAIEMLFMMCVPYLLLFAIVTSQVVFISGLIAPNNFIFEGIPTQYWILGIVIYYSEIMFALAYDGEDTFSNMVLTIMMYFTYCQIWPLTIMRGFYADVIQRKTRDWDKTIRFETTIEQQEGQVVDTMMGLHPRDHEKKAEMLES